MIKGGTVKKALLVLSLIIGIPNILATLISLSPIQEWWVRILDFPPLQILACLIFSLILLLTSVRFPRKAILQFFFLLLIGCSFYHAYGIWPYTSLHKYRSLPATRLNDRNNQISFVYCNVFMENRKSDLCIAVVKEPDPDVILFVETDQWWANKIKVLKRDYPYTAELPLENTYGMILYSRIPFEKSSFRFLVRNDVPSLAPVFILPSGQKIQTYFIHPKPPVKGESESSEERDAEYMMIADSARKSNLPVIVAGDLNDVGWSATSLMFQRMSQLLDPRVGRGLYTTYNANYPLFRWPLDHIFHSVHFRVVDLKKLGYTGSDHFPIYIKLSYEPEGRFVQKPLKFTKHDIEDSREKKERVGK